MTLMRQQARGLRNLRQPDLKMQGAVITQWGDTQKNKSVNLLKGLGGQHYTSNGAFVKDKTAHTDLQLHTDM